MDLPPHNLYSSTGLVRGGEEGQKPGWYYLKCDDSLGEYYKWFFSRDLVSVWWPPMNGVHITFISGEKDSRLVQKGEMFPFLGELVEFDYSLPIFTNRRAFWMTVQSKRLDQIRESLGLPQRVLHLTLGNIKNALRQSYRND